MAVEIALVVRDFFLHGDAFGKCTQCAEDIGDGNPMGKIPVQPKFCRFYLVCVLSLR